MRAEVYNDKFSASIHEVKSIMSSQRFGCTASNLSALAQLASSGAVQKKKVLRFYGNFPFFCLYSNHSSTMANDNDIMIFARCLGSRTPASFFLSVFLRLCGFVAVGTWIAKDQLMKQGRSAYSKGVGKRSWMRDWLRRQVGRSHLSAGVLALMLKFR